MFALVHGHLHRTFKCPVAATGSFMKITKSTQSEARTHRRRSMGVSLKIDCVVSSTVTRHVDVWRKKKDTSRCMPNRC